MAPRESHKSIAEAILSSSHLTNPAFNDDAEHPDTALFWRFRADGSRHINTETEARVLRQTLPNAADPSERPLADLIVNFLAPGLIPFDSDFEEPEDRQSVDNAFLTSIGLELKALKLAIQSGDLSPEKSLCLLSALEQRISAGAELLRRLQHARWDMLSAAAAP